MPVIRDDITVAWGESPRIITVAAPSVEITMQDLRDTLRAMEMTDVGILYAPLLETSGKQDLGDQLYVGLTVKLLNAKIAFEARPGPEWILCTMKGGNCVSVDVNGVTMDVRKPTAFTSVDRVSATSGSMLEHEEPIVGVPRGVARLFSLGLPQDGLSVSAILSKDAGNFAGLTNPIVGKGNRQYVMSLTDTEMDGADLYLLISAAGMEAIPLTIQTSGYPVNA